MRDIEAMFDEARDVVSRVVGEENIGFIYRPITINYRAKSRWGRCECSSDRKRFRIQISYRLLSENADYDAVMSTLIHEILHACKGGQSHKGMWKTYATRVNVRFPQYNITRTTSAATFGLEMEYTIPESKYEIKCEHCGKIFHRTKMSAAVQHPERYRCGVCNGKLIRIK